MATIIPEKRTRSQLTLPDNLYQLTLARSPLKDARTRLQSEPLSGSMGIAASDDGFEDELLTPNKKRAASPWRDSEYASNSAKRSRREASVEKVEATPRSKSVPAFPLLDVRNAPSSPTPESVHKSTISEPPSPPDNTLQTPTRISAPNDVEMSPLTPLPETPAPWNSKNLASSNDSAMEIDVTPRVVASSASTMFSKSVSRLPKPTFAPKASYSKPPPKPKVDAYSVLMGKVTQAGPSSSVGKGKTRSLKGSMKPKAVAKPKPFVPPVQCDDELVDNFPERLPSPEVLQSAEKQEKHPAPAIVQDSEPATSSAVVDAPSPDTSASSHTTDSSLSTSASTESPLFTEPEDDAPKVVPEPSASTADMFMEITPEASVPEIINTSASSNSMADAIPPTIVSTSNSVQGMPSSDSIQDITPSGSHQGLSSSDSKKTLKAGVNKKKQVASGIPRVTRASQKKKEQQADKAGQAPRSTLARKKAVISAVKSSPNRKDAMVKALSPLSDLEKDGDPDTSTSKPVPKTPTKLPSFAKPTQSSLAKTPAVLRSPVKPTTSPSKLVRSITTRPPAKNAFEPDKDSVLYRLNSKMDALRQSMNTPVMPAPCDIPRSAPALVQRSVTLDSATFNKAGPSSAARAGPSTSSVASSSKHGQQRGIADFLTGAAPVGKRLLSGKGKTIFPHKPTQKVSQRTPLAAVPGSPVKRSDTLDIDDEPDPMFEAKLAEMAARAHEQNDDELKGLLLNAMDKGKRKATTPDKEAPDHSRRVSTAEAFSSLRQEPGSMGPPATPPRRGGLRSTSHTLPVQGSSAELHARPHSSLGVVRTPADTEEGEALEEDEQDSVEDKNYRGGLKKATTGLKVLSHVRAFVDVKDEDTNEDASEPFVEMLQALGAKVLSTMSKTCTHIVFKDGTINTVNKWREREVKPIVVRVGWVFKCVQQKAHIDEAEHLMDISGLFRSGVAPKQVKRRQSKIPKLTSRTTEHGSGDGDVSMDGSEISMDMSIGPLALARRRHSELK